MIDRPVTIAGGEYRITCLSMGNPHCVVFVDRVDEVDVAHLGPQFEHADIFPARTNTEFIRVVNRTTIKMRVWERGNGETRACGTGACAAVVAAVENGLCPKGETHHRQGHRRRPARHLRRRRRAPDRQRRARLYRRDHVLRLAKAKNHPHPGRMRVIFLLPKRRFPFAAPLSRAWRRRRRRCARCRNSGSEYCARYCGDVISAPKSCL